MNGTYEVIGKIVFSAGVYTVWSMILGAVANGGLILSSGASKKKSVWKKLRIEK